MKASLKRQQGVTLTGVIVIGMLIVLVAVAGMRILPDVIEYYSILKDAKAVVQDPASRGATVSDIRRAFDRRAQIDDITSIKGLDLDISKEGNEIVIAFAYVKKIPLAAKVSLVIDFEGSTAGSAK